MSGDNSFSAIGFLFYQAQQNIIDSYNQLKNKRNNIIEVKKYPKDFEYKADIDEICSCIEKDISEIAHLERLTSESKERLISLDSEFAAQYFQAATSKYDYLNGRLTEEERQYIEFSNAQFEEYLFKYLKEGKEKGILSPEQLDAYNQMKPYNDMKNKMSELDELNDLISKKYKNVPVDPRSYNGRNGYRVTKEQIDSYEKYLKEYNDVHAKQKQLKKEIEKLQKDTGTYQNKWYEDLGEAFTKTGAAWSKAFKSWNLSDFKDAYEQTKATKTVITTSCISGVFKLAELGSDGVVGFKGIENSCFEWGKTLLKTFSIEEANKEFSKSMDATLDYINIDWTKKLNDWFYKDTEVGRCINAKSNLKYDSAGAQALQDASRYATEFGICCIPGMQWAAPVILGFEGAGKSVEDYTKTVDREHGENYNYGKAVIKEVTGFASGYAKGKMNVAFGSTIKNFSSIKSAIGSMKGTMRSTVWQEIKEGGKNLVTQSLKKTLKDLDTWSDMGCIILDDVEAGFDTGHWDWKKMGVDVLSSFGSNLLFQYSGDILSNKFIKSADSSVSSFFDVDYEGDYYGAFQDSTSRYKKIIANNPDWFDSNYEGLSKMMKEKYNVENPGVFIDRWKNNGDINDFTKNFLEEYVNSSNLPFSQKLDVLDSIFKIKEEMPEYIRQKNILINKGLSEVDAIKVLDSMNDSLFGIENCTYASTANALFSQFDGNEKAFKETFGFDMYVDIDGKKRLNSNELILDMYLFNNSNVNGSKYYPGELFNIAEDGKFSVTDITARRVRSNNNDILINYLSNKGISIDNISCTNEMHAFDGPVNKEIFLKETNIDLDSGTSYKLDLTCKKGNQFGINEVPIQYFDENGTLLCTLENNGHSVFITDVLDDGIQVSSWGKKCFIPYTSISNNKTVQVFKVKVGV